MLFLNDVTLSDRIILIYVFKIEGFDYCQFQNKDTLQGELEELRAAHVAAVNDLHASRDKVLTAQHHASELGRQLEVCILLKYP